MGSKTVKTSENKPSHKIPVAIKKKQKQPKKCTFSDLPLYEKKCLRTKQILEGLLQLGIDRNDESVQKLTHWLEKTMEPQRQRALARKLIKNPMNYSLIPDRVGKEMKDQHNKMVVSALVNVPETALVLLHDRLMDKFGPSYKSFVGLLQNNIWLKVLLRCLQDDAGFSDEEMAEMHPLHQLWLLSNVSDNEEWIMKVLVREFDLKTTCACPVEDIITELVEKMVKAFAEVAPEELVALGVQGISLVEKRRV